MLGFVITVTAILLFIIAKYASKIDAKEEKDYERMRGEEILRARAERSAAQAAAQASQKDAEEPNANSNYKERTYRVSGISFREDAVENIGSENDDYHMTKQELIRDDMTDEQIWEYSFHPRHTELVPEPTNQYDPNAIKVIVDGEHIGYIKSGSCVHVLKLINEERILNIQCQMGGGRYKYLSEKYDDEKDKDVYVLERDSINYWASLTIREKTD